jgi:hypothetical protein
MKEPQEGSLSLADKSSEIQTRHLPNTGQND